MLPARDHVEEVDLQENSNLTDTSLVPLPQDGMPHATDRGVEPTEIMLRPFLEHFIQAELTQGPLAGGGAVVEDVGC